MGYIFRDEYIEREPSKSHDQQLHERLKLLARFGEIAVDSQKDEITIQNDKEKVSFFLDYFEGMGHYIGDAYLIVLLALEDICEGNHIINETRLFNELHTTIIAMYNDNLVKQLPSCLRELIETALRRFTAINVAVINQYTTISGSSISFVSCPFERLQKIEELKNKVNELQQFNQR